MVTSTPEHLIQFDTDRSAAATFDQVRDKSRAYLDNAIHAAQEHPWAAAAIGAGVVAAAAATAYGATKLARRGQTTDGEEMIDPEVVPEALPVA